MSLLFRVVFANECTSTHHKLALDALRHLQDEDAERWRNLFLYYFDEYLEGSKAPDKKFKDFRNHVLHVHDNYWGGAVRKADEWYKTAVREFRKGAWAKAIYSAGVLSHYFTDPFMPFHTAQSEEETQIHRAVEWSIAKSYDELQNVLEEQGGYPEVDELEGDDWLGEMIRAGAEIGNMHYQTIIDHYDLDAGVKDPPSGLDQTIKDAIAEQLGLAAVSFARVLEQIFDEADVEPPKANVTLGGYLAKLTIPIGWVTRKMADSKDRKVVQAMYKEFKTKGRVDKTMPADDREVRRLHAEEVLHVSVSELDERPLGAIGQQHGEGTETRQVSHKPVVSISQKTVQTAGDSDPKGSKKKLRHYLKPADDVVDAPSIGSKTAKRLQKIGITTVQQLLACDPEEVAKQLRVRYVDTDLVEDWQAQAGLVCNVPNLRGHDAQILVACDYAEPQDVAEASVDDLLAEASQFATSREGQRLLRGNDPPDRDEIEDWIEWASLSTKERTAA
jgi:predicted flap endonuclease-1-like 5' DNA nuclease